MFDVAKIKTLFQSAKDFGKEFVKDFGITFYILLIMNRIDRNKILVRHIIKSGLAVSQKDLGQKLGYSNESYFSQILNCKVEYPKDFIQKLKSLLPNLNELWLLNGLGEMLGGDYVGQFHPTGDVPASTAPMSPTELLEYEKRKLKLEIAKLETAITDKEFVVKTLSRTVNRLENTIDSLNEAIDKKDKAIAALKRHMPGIATTIEVDGQETEQQ